MHALAEIRGHNGLLIALEQNDLAQSLLSIRAQQHTKKSKMEADVAGLFEDTPPICSPGTREGPRLKVEQRQNLLYLPPLFCNGALQGSCQKKPALVDDLKGLEAKHPQVLLTSIAEARRPLPRGGDGEPTKG